MRKERKNKPECDALYWGNEPSPYAIRKIGLKIWTKRRVIHYSRPINIGHSCDLPAHLNIINVSSAYLQYGSDLTKIKLIHN